MASNTAQSNNESGGGGFIIGAGVVVIIAIGLFFIYGLPAIKNRSTMASSTDYTESAAGSYNTGGSAITPATNTSSTTSKQSSQAQYPAQ